MKLVIFVILLVLVSFVAIVFGAENNAITSVNFLIAKTDIRVSTLVAISILIGCIITSVFWFLLTVTLRVKLANARHQLVKQIKKTN